MRWLVFVTAVASLVACYWPSAEAKSFCAGLWTALVLVAGE